MLDKIYFEIAYSPSQNGIFSKSDHKLEHHNCLVAYEKLLKKFNYPIDNFDDLIQKDYHSFVKFPHILTSQTHTQSVSISAIAFASDFKSIGIDLEKTDRVISENIHRFFINEKDDDNLKTSPLKNWTLKEAIYKAVNPINVTKKNSLNEFYIDSEFNFYNENRLLGIASLEKLVINGSEFIFAKAAVLN